MKDLIISLVLFALILTGIALNAHYINSVSDDLTSYASRLTTEENTDTLLQELSERWKKAQRILDWTVPHRETEKISEIILSLQTAAECGDLTAFSRYRKLLEHAAEGLKRAENIAFSFFSQDANMRLNTTA